MEKEFKVARNSLLFVYLLMLPFLVEAGVTIYNLLARPEATNPYFSIPWVVGVLYIVYIYLKMPYSVTIKGNESLVFKSLFKEFEIPIKSLQSLRTNFMKFTLSFRYNGGRVMMLYRIENFRELLGFIKKRNKSFDTTYFR